MNDVKGPFELHVVVELGHESLLQKWILEESERNKYSLINPKLTGFCAFYGQHPIHLMLSCFVQCSAEEAVRTIHLLQNSMKKVGIKVLRAKVEANLHAENVPNEVTMDEYYEVHFKVPISNFSSWNQLAELCVPFGAHLFINNRSKTKGLHAIVTVRSYNTTFNKFEQDIEALERAIWNASFDIKSIRKEYSFYDTNLWLDKGWLFDTDPHTPKRSLDLR